VIRAVIDTNVLVSGLLSPAGNEAMILLAIHHGIVRVCLSEAIIAEYAAVLPRPKFGFPPDEIQALLDMLRSHGELVRPEGSSPASPDPGDTKFLQCAQAAGADFIVTGNKRDFPDPPYGPTHVVSAGELLERLTLEA
jgi:putative PIN family toxin of toxin-antitoxin system